MESADTNGDVTGLRGDVVLGLCSDGRDELRRPQAGLSLPQRRLLKRIDGRRTLKEIAGADPTLHANRVARDAALLLGLGLVELEHGMLQPITRPSTLPSMAAASVDAPAAPRTLSPRPATRQPARRPDATNRRRPQWSRALAAVVAGGVLVALAVHSLRTAPPVAPPAAAMTPKPITWAPSLPAPIADRMPSPSNESGSRAPMTATGPEQARLAQR